MSSSHPHETLAKEIAQLEAKGSRSAELEQKESLLRAVKGVAGDESDAWPPWL